MAVNVATLEARLEANTRDFNSDLDRATGKIRDFNDTATRTGGGGGGLALMKKGMAVLAGSIAVQKIVDFGKASLDAAVAAEEAGSAFATTFGPATVDAAKFVDEFANKAGFANFELEQMLANTGNVVQGLGGTEEQSRLLSEKMAILAGDVASFSNAAGGAPAVLAALTSALTGEREALKTYGIVVGEADVQQRAMLDSGKTLTSELSPLEKAMATLEIATERAGKAVGDLDRTSESAANKQRELRAKVLEAQTAIAEALLPALEASLPTLITWAEAFGTFFGRDTPGRIEGIAAALTTFGVGFETALTDRQLGRLVDAGVNFEELEVLVRATEDEFNRFFKTGEVGGRRLASLEGASRRVVTVIQDMRDAYGEAAKKIIDADRAQRDHARHQGRHGRKVDESVKAILRFNKAVGEDGKEGMQAATLEGAKTLEALGKAFTDAGGNINDVLGDAEGDLARFEETLRTEMGNAAAAVDLLNDVPDQIEVTVDEMLERIGKIREAEDLMHDNMRRAGEMGLEALVAVMEEQGPQTAEAWASILDDGVTEELRRLNATMENAALEAAGAFDNPEATARMEGTAEWWASRVEEGFDPDLSNAAEVAAQRLRNETEAARWRAVGDQWESWIEQGFNPNLNPGGGGSGGGGSGGGGGFVPQFDPMALLSGVTGGSAAPAAVAAAAAAGGGTHVTMSFEGATLVGSGIEDAVLSAWQRLQRDGRVK